MNPTKEHRQKVSLVHSCQIRTLYQVGGVKGKNLLKMFPQYSKSAVYKHCKLPLNEEKVDKRKSNPGRPKKLSENDERQVKRSLLRLRETTGRFTSKRVQEESGVTHVSNRSIRRSLNRRGYYFLQSRKKGLMTKDDLKKRLAFCRKIKRLKMNEEFWRKGVSFYLDGVGFEYKTNPQGEARSPATRAWRKKSEGLSIHCVAKGKKEGKRNANFMVAFGYGCGVIMNVQYFGQITGTKFSDIVRDHFPSAFQRSPNPRGKRFLMDGCPRQNSKLSKKAIDAVGGKIFSIPPRSPDLNPIENFFHLAGNRLRAEAIEKKISSETFEEFSQRVVDCLQNFNSEDIDKIIDSMEKRIDFVIKSKGQRIKY